MTKLLCALLLACLAAGCGTIAARVRNEAPEVRLYPATACDVVGFYLFCCTGIIHMEGQQPLGTTIAFRTVAPLLMVVDTPISLSTDTLLLPYDLYRWGNVPGAPEEAARPPTVAE